MRTISLQRARGIAIAAQGLDRSRPSGRVDLRHLRRAMASVGALQIDSVNVVERAHNLTLFSRLGPHPGDLLERAFRERREVFEYWGHEASFLAVTDWPVFRHRMDGMRPWRAVRRIRQEHPGYIEAVLAEVAAHGPLTTSDLTDQGPSRREAWWGWTEGKLALEWLFATGEVTVAERRNFTRYYDLPERVLPAEVLAAEPLPRADAHRLLVLRAARSMGIATAKGLADYYRLPITEARRIVAGLSAAGSLEEVEVPGWREPAFLHPEARHPRRVEGRALLCPFDPLIWFRERVERLFGFHYRIEIYTPPARRRYGYYVFPFLLGDGLVGRVDLKADRAAGALLVRGSFGEEGIDPAGVAAALAKELGEMARWLGLDDVVVADRGDLAPALRRAVGAPGGTG